MTTANGSHDCSKFPPPGSLKDLLDLYAKLAEKVTNGTNGTPCNVTDPTKEVLKELKSRLTGKNNNGWIRKGNSGENGGANWFYKETASTDGTGCVMPKSILGLRELQGKILQPNGTNDNTKYTLPNDNPDTDPCIKKYADAIIQNVFPLLGCLFYLWFI